jgi:hypothetical protein
VPYLSDTKPLSMRKTSDPAGLRSGRPAASRRARHRRARVQASAAIANRAGARARGPRAALAALVGTGLSSRAVAAAGRACPVGGVGCESIASVLSCRVGQTVPLACLPPAPLLLLLLCCCCCCCPALVRCSVQRCQCWQEIDLGADCCSCCAAAAAERQRRGSGGGSRWTHSRTTRRRSEWFVLVRRGLWPAGQGCNLP